MATNYKTDSSALKSGLTGLLIGVLIGIGVGYFAFITDTIPPTSIVKNQTKKVSKSESDNFQYLNPSIAHLDFSSIDFTAIEGLDTILILQTEEAKKNGKLKEAAIYFRDLTTNQKIGIHESEIFSPASLMKVPIMVAILKYAESKPHILNQNLVYRNAKQSEYLDNKNRGLHLKTKLINGSEYTVSQLIDIMIVESDNEATILLIDFINEENPVFLSQVEQELGMIVPDGIDFNENFLTIRTYASFFRVLYNSSYLEKKYSEMALEILSRTGYGFGIRQSIPKEISVAHKYGVKLSKDNYVQLHHFGIVYHQKKPFLIGIMTKGDHIDNLRTFISDITSTLYQQIEERSKKSSERGYKKDIED